MTTKEKILKYIDYKGISKRDFYRQTGLSNGFLDSGKHIGSDNIKIIISAYPEINIEWLVMDNGEMLKTKCEENVLKKNEDKPNVKKMSSFDKTTGKRPPLTPEKAQELQNIASGAFLAQKPKLIPVYGVSTIGGTNIGAEMSPVSEPEGYIEAGGWFPSVTAAIYHYGDSMEEYPAGVLLALQEVYNRRNIIWGSNYVIETSEIRITKRLQTCPDDKNYIMAYSSNKETYPDGKLVHEPITIHKEDITRLFLVIGVIKKEQMSAPILIKPNRG
ncbi:hypothetical protein ACILE9_07220 [Capnocytophaga cynodegmi]|uniref:hypothetical protein n=1 Tax=Capnocytophaga cynodegmi TaxID=28189 RepID=UPI0037CFA29A